MMPRSPRSKNLKLKRNLKPQKTNQKRTPLQPLTIKMLRKVVRTMSQPIKKEIKTNLIHVKILKLKKISKMIRMQKKNPQILRKFKQRKRMIQPKNLKMMRKRRKQSLMMKKKMRTKRMRRKRMKVAAKSIVSAKISTYFSWHCSCVLNGAIDLKFLQSLWPLSTGISLQLQVVLWLTCVALFWPCLQEQLSKNACMTQFQR